MKTPIPSETDKKSSWDHPWSKLQTNSSIIIQIKRKFKIRGRSPSRGFILTRSRTRIRVIGRGCCCRQIVVEIRPTRFGDG